MCLSVNLSLSVYLQMLHLRQFLLESADILTQFSYVESLSDPHGLWIQSLLRHEISHLRRFNDSISATGCPFQGAHCQQWANHIA